MRSSNTPSTPRALATIALLAVLSTLLLIHVAPSDPEPNPSRSRPAQEKGYLPTDTVPLPPRPNPIRSHPVCCAAPDTMVETPLLSSAHALSPTTSHAISHIDRWGNSSSLAELARSLDEHSSLRNSLHADLAAKLLEGRLDRQARAIIYLLHYYGNAETQPLLLRTLESSTPHLSNAGSPITRSDVILAKSFALRTMEAITSKRVTFD